MTEKDTSTQGIINFIKFHAIGISWKVVQGAATAEFTINGVRVLLQLSPKKLQAAVWTDGNIALQNLIILEGNEALELHTRAHKEAVEDKATKILRRLQQGATT